MHSLMSVFHGRIQVIERENHSVAEVVENLELVHKVLVKRKNKNFMSSTAKIYLIGCISSKLEETSALVKTLGLPNTSEKAIGNTKV